MLVQNLEKRIDVLRGSKSVSVVGMMTGGVSLVLLEDGNYVEEGDSLVYGYVGADVDTGSLVLRGGGRVEEASDTSSSSGMTCKFLANTLKSGYDI